MSTLVGLQLLISWFLMRALEELSQREIRVAGDMAGHEAIEAEAEVEVTGHDVLEAGAGLTVYPEGA